MPVYNGEAFIAESIASVLAQTYPNWELIVVDDGSTDGTATIVASFGDLRIRYAYQENYGLPAARNAGIRLARGEFLAFLDADDLWDPQFFQACLGYLAGRQDVAGVYTASRMIDPQGRVLPQRGDAYWSGVDLHRRLLEGGFFPPNAVLVRAAVVRDVGLFDTDLRGRGTEDWDLWLRITERYSMQRLAKPLAYYRVYPGSMATDAAGMHDNRMSVLAKRFGPPDGEPVSWPEEKRRVYGFAYRTAALAYIQQGQPGEGWQFLRRAVDVYPPLLEQVDTFYELACGNQPRGYRGQADMLDLEASAAEIFRRLDDLFARARPPVTALRRRAYGNAHLALGMLADRAGDWHAARRYLWRAARHDPRLVSGSFLRRLVKVSAGKRLAGLLKSLCEPADSWARAELGEAPGRERA
jgi:hypothetical protein